MMTKGRFVYVIYIAASPEKVWEALTDGELTRQYWGHSNVSDWQAGSVWEHQRLDSTRKVEVTGKVVDSTPPHRLVITWGFRPEEVSRPEEISRVTFNIEPYRDSYVQLTVIHEDLEPGSDMERGISQGWPFVLSNLKSFLETGKAIPV